MTTMQMIVVCSWLALIVALLGDKVTSLGVKHQKWIAVIASVSALAGEYFGLI